MLNYNHLIEIKEDDRKLTIYRVYEDNRKELFTEVDIPLGAVAHNEDRFVKFACQLGENLLMDSPVARKLLDL